MRLFVCELPRTVASPWDARRVKFYDLLKAINANCFQAASRRFTVPSRGSPSASKRQALFYLPEAQLILLIWAMKHEQPQVADSGLQAPETRSAP